MSNQQTLPNFKKHVSHSNKGKSLEVELEAMHDIDRQNMFAGFYRRAGTFDIQTEIEHLILVNAGKENFLLVGGELFCRGRALPEMRTFENRLNFK